MRTTRGGYCTGKNIEPEPGPYRTLMTGIEAALGAARLAMPADDDDEERQQNYSVDKYGRRYKSILPQREAGARPEGALSVVDLPLADRTDLLRDRLIDLRDDLVDRMVRRGNPEPGQLPILAGIEATLRMLDGDDVGAPDNRPPDPAPRGSAMATADPDGEHVRLELDVSGAHASLRLDPLLALRLSGEVLDAVGLVMRPMLTGLWRATR